MTEKGEAFLASADFAEAGAKDLDEAKKTAEAALESMGEPLNPRKIKERALLEVFDDAYWDAAHESCIKCGTCHVSLPDVHLLRHPGRSERKLRLQGKKLGHLHVLADNPPRLRPQPQAHGQGAISPALYA